MARIVVGFSTTDTGYTIGSCTFGHCNRLDTGAAIDTTGSTLTHQSNGQYVLNIPNVTTATGPAAFFLYVTADTSKYVEGTINPALGDEALNSTVAKEATVNKLKSFPKNTEFANFMFPLVDANGAAATGLTVTAQRSIDGGAYASCANAVSEVGNGTYKITLAAADLNGDVVMLKFTAATARQVNYTVVTEA